MPADDAAPGHDTWLTPLSLCAFLSTQGGSCGRGMRGQLANSPGIRTGFEGGQMPLYRRLPKLRGIAGGMPAGRKTHVVVNLADLSAAVAAGKLDVNAELTLATLKEARLVNASGAERKLPLKVLGEGDLTQPLKVKAASFSASAREKLAAAGGAAIDDAGKAKWTRALGERRKAAAEAAAPPTPKGKGGPAKK